MKRINTIEELKAERKRLSAYSLELERNLRTEFRLLKKDLRPANLLFGGTQKEISQHKDALLSVGAGSLAGFLTRKFLMRNSGVLARFIVPSVVGKLASGIVERHKAAIFDAFKNVASKLSFKKEVKENIDHRTEEFLY